MDVATLDGTPKRRAAVARWPQRDLPAPASPPPTPPCGRPLRRKTATSDGRPLRRMVPQRDGAAPSSQGSRFRRGFHRSSTFAVRTPRHARWSVRSACFRRAQPRDQIRRPANGVRRAGCHRSCARNKPAHVARTAATAWNGSNRGSHRPGLTGVRGRCQRTTLSCDRLATDRNVERRTSRRSRLQRTV